MEWFKFYPAQWYRQTRGMTDAKKGGFIDATADALTDGKKGVNAFADFMLEQAARDSQLQRERAAGRWGKDKKTKGGTDAGGCRGKPRFAKEKDRQTETERQRREKEKKERGPVPTTRERAPARDADGDGGEVGSVGLALSREGGSGESRANRDGNTSGNYPQGAIDSFRKSPNKGELLRALPAESATMCILDYCGEANPRAAARGYDKQRKGLGDANFKNVCAAFVEGLESGEDPEPGNRGAALMARLKDAQEWATEGER